MQASSAIGDTANPEGNVLGKTTSVDLYINEAPTANLAATAITSTIGGGQSHANIQPFQCVNYTIALVGIFPSRNSPEPSAAGAVVQEVEAEKSTETKNKSSARRTRAD